MTTPNGGFQAIGCGDADWHQDGRNFEVQKIWGFFGLRLRIRLRVISRASPVPDWHCRNIFSIMGQLNSYFFSPEDHSSSVCAQPVLMEKEEEGEKLLNDLVTASSPPAVCPASSPASPPASSSVSVPPCEPPASLTCATSSPFTAQQLATPSSFPPPSAPAAAGVPPSLYVRLAQPDDPFYFCALGTVPSSIAFGISGPPLHIFVVDDGVTDAPKVELKDKQLWEEFHKFGNEMIITKSGRRIFPSMSVKLSGLDEKANYYVIMDIVPRDANVWEFSDSRWAVARPIDPPSAEELLTPLHIHPNSPASGEHWMREGVSFRRVKIATSNEMNRAEFTVLKPMQKYCPRIHIVRSDNIYSQMATWNTSSFAETEFFAVTSYQNNLVCDKKIDHNPFAKRFREFGQAKKSAAERKLHVGS
ncbi:hypothetical protein niasHT_004183 [Heterodera trifolii]|uniref:T-box domain-containing protein n=1 Tax=Heterodera trifolii TaxID=157864 RepID=A0ABD2ME41_9BILA